MLGFQALRTAASTGHFSLCCMSEQVMGNLPGTLSNYHRTSNILLRTNYCLRLFLSGHDLWLLSFTLSLETYCFNKIKVTFPKKGWYHISVTIAKEIMLHGVL